MRMSSNDRQRFLTGVALAGWASVAAGQQSQDAPPTAVEEVVVTGIRQSLDASIETKRRATQFVDAVVAEDIGKLPDINVAEALQRVSGLQIRRGAGEGTSVSIRGLRQNNIEVNGRPVVSPTGRGPDTSAHDGSYDLLNTIPSEVIRKLEVTKLLSADQTEGSLGGTINIVTRRPLDVPGFAVSASVQGIYSDAAEDTGFKASGLISNSFADDRVGALLNVVYSQTEIREDSFNSFTGFIPLTGAGSDPNGDGRPGVVIQDLRYQTRIEARDKLGINGSLQWRPTDALDLYADALYSETVTDRRRDWLGVPLSASLAAYTAPTLSADETLVSGTINARVQGNTEQFEIDVDSLATAVGANWTGGAWHANLWSSYTEATLLDPQIFDRTQSAAVLPVSFDFGGRIPSVTLPTGFDLADRANMNVSLTFDMDREYASDELSFGFDLARDFTGGPFTALQLGARLADTSTTLDSNTLTTAIGAATAGINAGTLPASSTEVASYPDFLDGAGFVPGPYLVVVPFANSANGLNCGAFTACSPPTRNFVESFAIDEKQHAGYLKAVFDTTLASLGVAGNIGVRYVNSSLDALGSTLSATGTPVPLASSRSYDDWLPSAVARITLTEALLVRVGAAKVMARPNTIDLQPGFNIGRSNPVTPTATAGNPLLDPFRATQFDASLEWYFQDHSALTLGLFYKDVKTFISTQSAFETLPGEPVPVFVTRRVNGSGGHIKGIEVLYQQAFDFLPAPFDGFGIQSTYSYIDSTTSLVNSRNGATLPIEGLSKNNANVVAYYDKGRLGARVAYNWRDEYLDRIGGGGVGIFFDTYSSLDASLRFKLTDAVSLEAEGGNLTDEPLVRYATTRDALNSYAKTGRRFTLGVRASF